MHTHVTLRMDLQAKAIVDLACKPWVWTIHGRYVPNQTVYFQWARALETMQGGNCRITAVSSATKQHFCQVAAAEKSRVAVVYSGVESHNGSNLELPEPSLRQDLGIPDDSVLFGTCGRCVPAKAFDIFLVAAKELLTKSYKLQFLLAGDGPLLEGLRQQARNLGIDKNVHFLGFRRDVPEILANLDVFFMSSRSEALPLALIEALSAGLPCVATNVGGIPEILGRDGGLLVESENPEALAAAMQKMLDPQTRARFRAKAPTIAERFSMERCAREYEGIYQELLSDAHKPIAQRKSRE